MYFRPASILLLTFLGLAFLTAISGQQSNRPSNKDLRWGVEANGFRMAVWTNPANDKVYGAVRNPTSRKLCYCREDDDNLGIYARKNAAGEWQAVPFKVAPGEVVKVAICNAERVNPRQEMPAYVLKGSVREKTDYSFVIDLNKYRFPAELGGTAQIKVVQHDVYCGGTKNTTGQIESPPITIKVPAVGLNTDEVRVARPKVQSSDNIKVILLGTAVGPPLNLRQYGASTLVEAGNVRLLFDCGRGATLRLAQMGIPLGSVNRLFLTHLHSDHVVQIPDLLLAGWVGGGRKVPLEVWGPEGTVQMMDHLLKAFAFDIHMRRDLDERAPASGIEVISHDIKQEVVFDQQGVKVTAFLVDHSPVAPAFVYRVDFRGHSVVLSGDTRFSDNLIRFSKGTDVLIHEVLDAETVQAWFPNNPKLADAILAKHTTPEQAGEVFARVKPRLAVYSHAPDAERIITLTRKTYSGPLQGAEDLLTIEISEKIEVRHFFR